MELQFFTHDEKNRIVFRLTALWALIESGLGGILHLFQFPLSGIILSGFAVSILCLIYYFSERSTVKLIQSLIIVLLIKYTLSPFTPFAAIIAVCFQTFISIIVYRVFSIHWVSILMVHLISFWESALQKIIVLVVVFGNEMVKVINDFSSQYIPSQLKFLNLSASTFLVIIYFGIYTISAIVASFLAFRLFKFVSTNRIRSYDLQNSEEENYSVRLYKLKRIKKSIWISLGVSLVFIGILSLLSDNIKIFLIIVLRSIAVTCVWVYIVLPLLKYLMDKYFKRKHSEYMTQINEVREFFPRIILLIQSSYAFCLKYPSLKRIPTFMERLSYLLIFYKDR